MIEVTKLNGSTVLVNAEMIESVEETPDTVLSFVTGKKLIVKESRIYFMDEKGRWLKWI